MSEDELSKLIEEVKKQFLKAQSHTGENVGAIAAQSIGEPTTQMTVKFY